MKAFNLDQQYLLNSSNLYCSPGLTFWNNRSNKKISTKMSDLQGTITNSTIDNHDKIALIIGANSGIGLET